MLLTKIKTLASRSEVIVKENKMKRVGVTEKPKVETSETITTPIGTGLEGVNTRVLTNNEYAMYHPVATRNISSYQVSYYRNYKLDMDNPTAIQDKRGIIHIPEYKDLYNQVRDVTPVVIIEEVHTYTELYPDLVAKLNNLYLGRVRNGLSPNSSVSYESVRCVQPVLNNKHSWQVVILTTINKELVDRYKSLFVSDLGVQVLNTIPKANNDVYHPLFNNGFIMDNLRSKLNGNLFSLTIVDNKSPKNTVYYAKVGGVVYEIMAEQSSIQHDGIHFTVILADSTHKQTEHIELEDINKYGVYRNKIDAENGDEYSSKDVKKQLQSELSEVSKEIDKNLGTLDKVKEQIANRKKELVDVDAEHKEKHQTLVETLDADLRDKRVKKEETETRYLEKTKEVKAKYADLETSLKDKLKLLEKQIKEKEEQLEITNNTTFFNKTVETLEKNNALANSSMSGNIRATKQDGEIIIPTVKDLQRVKEFITK